MNVRRRARGGIQKGPGSSAFAEGTGVRPSGGIESGGCRSGCCGWSRSGGTQPPSIGASVNISENRQSSVKIANLRLSRAFLEKNICASRIGHHPELVVRAGLAGAPGSRSPIFGDIRPFREKKVRAASAFAALRHDGRAIMSGAPGPSHEFTSLFKK